MPREEVVDEVTGYCCDWERTDSAMGKVKAMAEAMNGMWWTMQRGLRLMQRR
jgi:hypothetical protein